MRGRVIGGTPRFGDRSLCDTCRYAMIVQGVSAQDRIVRCKATYHDRLIGFHVTDCNYYLERAKIDYDEMKKTAWIVMVNKGGRIGFRQPHEVRWNNNGDPEDR